MSHALVVASLRLTRRAGSMTHSGRNVFPALRDRVDQDCQQRSPDVSIRASIVDWPVGLSWILRALASSSIRESGACETGRSMSTCRGIDQSALAGFNRSSAATVMASMPSRIEGSGSILNRAEWCPATAGPPALAASKAACGVPPTLK